jgi:hypothetical protein
VEDEPPDGMVMACEPLTLRKVTEVSMRTDTAVGSLPLLVSAGR